MLGVTLQLLHPGLCRFTCAQCQEWDYDFETGDIKTYGTEKLPRRRVVPPPCQMTNQTCPRVSPEREHEFRLTPSNGRVVEWYLSSRSLGVPDSWKEDGLLRRAFALIDGVYRASERAKLARSIGDRLALEIARLFGPPSRR